MSPSLSKMIGIADLVDMNPANVVKITTEKKVEAAIVFICPLLHAALVCDIIRKHDRKVEAKPTRVYIRKARVWNRVSSTALLTVAKETDAQLNPEVFRIEVVKPIVTGTILHPKPKRIGEK